ncbi:MAG: L,D-transpeptidase [Jatrophihabitantaceae bacterium]
MASRTVATALLLAAMLLGAFAGGTAGHRSTAMGSHGGFDPNGQAQAAVDAGRLTALSTVSTVSTVNYCRNNTVAQLVLVDIARQHAWLCAWSKTVYSTAVTTGMNHPSTHTPTGHFRIQGRTRDTVLQESNGDRYYVKYWIPFIGTEYGFHDSSWQHFPYGSPEYKTNGSHGCVHMPLAAVKYLYYWARIGASVYIRV